jgi:hypothetical protein
MLTSISPLGERARGNRWAVTATTYVVGSLLGGITIGALLGALGSLGRASLWAAAVVCAVAAVSDVVGRLPTAHRQVDEDWLTRYRSWVYAGGFGFQLGLGVVTIVTSAATYAALALALLSGRFVTGALIGGCFGLVRALPLLALHDAKTPERLHAVASRLEVLSGRASAATAAVLAAGAIALAVSA